MFSFIETRLFTKLVLGYMTDDEYLALQTALMTDPEAGPAIPGSGGVRKLRRKWKMAKTKRNVGREVLDGLREIKRGEYGRVINVPDVAMIREKTGLSQSRFASLLGVSVRTLQDWEQGRRAPSGAARTLLLVVAKNPRALLDVA
jgi:putative transcriptional regulator